MIAAKNAGLIPVGIASSASAGKTQAELLAANGAKWIYNDVNSVMEVLG